MSTTGRLAPVEQPSVCTCELTTESGPAGTILVLHVAGEIDLLTLPLLCDALTAALGERPDDLVVDLSAVSFCCARGYALLDIAAVDAQTNGTAYALSGMSPHLAHIAGLLWPRQHCTHYRSVAAAVTAIRIDQTYRA